MVEQKERSRSTKKRIFPASGFESKFVSSEKMTVLIEKIQKIEKTYPGEKKLKKRQMKQNEAYFLAALMSGFGGSFRKYVKKTAPFGAIHFAMFTDGRPESLLVSAAGVGFVSFCIMSKMIAQDMKKEFYDIRNAALEKNLK